MDEFELKPNSNKYKEEQKKLNSTPERQKLEKIVKGPVKTKKPSELKKITDSFISEDLPNIKSYILVDVLIPSAKKAISDIIKNGIDMLLYGSTGRSRASIAGKISYSGYYNGDRRDSDRRQLSNTQGRTRYSYDDIFFDTRGEAEEVLSRMDELIEMYGLVRVADLYDLVGITGDYTDNKYGWKNIRNARVERTRDGYAIKLPRALLID